MIARAILLLVFLPGCTAARIVRENDVTHTRTSVTAFALGYAGVSVSEPTPSPVGIPDVPPTPGPADSSVAHSPCERCSGICVCGGTMSRTYGEALSNLISAAGGAFAVYFGVTQ